MFGWPIDSIWASIWASVSGHPGKMNLPGHSLMCLYPGIRANWREGYLTLYPGRTHLSQISLLYPGIRKSPGPPRSLVPGPWSWSLVPGPWSLVLVLVLHGPGPWSLVLRPCFGPWSMLPSSRMRPCWVAANGLERNMLGSSDLLPIYR